MTCGSGHFDWLIHKNILTSFTDLWVSRKMYWVFKNKQLVWNKNKFSIPNSKHMRWLGAIISQVRPSVAAIPNLHATTPLCSPIHTNCTSKLTVRLSNWRRNAQRAVIPDPPPQQMGVCQECVWVQIWPPTAEPFGSIGCIPRIPVSN